MQPVPQSPRPAIMRDLPTVIPPGITLTLLGLTAILLGVDVAAAAEPPTENADEIIVTDQPSVHKESEKGTGTVSDSGKGQSLSIEMDSSGGSSATSARSESGPDGDEVTSPTKANIDDIDSSRNPAAVEAEQEPTSSQRPEKDPAITVQPPVNDAGKQTSAPTVNTPAPLSGQHSASDKAPMEGTGDTANTDRENAGQAGDSPDDVEASAEPDVYDSDIQDLMNKKAEKQRELEEKATPTETQGERTAVEAKELGRGENSNGVGSYDSDIEDLRRQATEQQQKQAQEQGQKQESQTPVGAKAEGPKEAQEDEDGAPAARHDSVPGKSAATEQPVAPAVRTGPPSTTQSPSSPAATSEGIYDSDIEELQQEHQRRKREEPLPPVEPDPAPEIPKSPPTSDAKTETVTTPAEAPPVHKAEPIAPAPVIEQPDKAPDEPSVPDTDEGADKQDTPASPTKQATPERPEAPPPAPPEDDDQSSKQWDWNWIDKQDNWGFDGLSFVGKYGLLAARLGGRVIIDGGLLAQQQSLDQAYPDFSGSKAIVRSAQAQLAGYFGPYIIFKAQAEFAPEFRGFKDAFIVFQEIPYVANLRLGIAKEPFSLENLTSFKFIPFMERSLMNALTPGRSFGALIYNNFFAQRMTLAAGMFYRSATWSDFEFDSSKGIDFTGRLTALPPFGLENSLVHIGISLLQRQHVGDISFSTTPETRLTDTRYVDTGDIEAETTSSLGLELAWQRGPMTLQAEVSQAQVANNQGPEPDFHGGYVMLDYTLTGETRRYARASGTFGSIRPQQPFSWREGQGRGALNTALRMSWVDLDDSGIRGGREHNISAALNWYPTAKFRFAVNYTHGYVSSLAEGRTNILQGRFQFEY